MALISPSRRLRRTPFSEGVEAAGVKAYTIYNHMLLAHGVPVGRGRLPPPEIRRASLGCGRVSGRWNCAGLMRGKLMQMLTPRDLRSMLPGQCFYVPIVDETGGHAERSRDAVKLAEDRWWISIADSDLLFWVKGLAYGFPP